MTTPVSEQKVSPEGWQEAINDLLDTALEYENCECETAECEHLPRFKQARKGLTEYVSSLESQLAEARRDTERLDWLEAPANERYRNYDSIFAPVTNLAGGWNGAASLRDAIDRAADSARGAPHD